MKTIKARVEEKTAPMGVEIADVRIKRADLPTQVYESVVNRMISERIQEAKEFRAQGEELALFIKRKPTASVRKFWLMQKSSQKSSKVKAIKKLQKYGLMQQIKTAAFMNFTVHYSLIKKLLMMKIKLL
jgi:regulator of protease activity HflC (stomatin/prohibitin superfamily)